jgi:hypothetical protein
MQNFVFILCGNEREITHYIQSTKIWTVDSKSQKKSKEIQSRILLTSLVDEYLEGSIQISTQWIDFFKYVKKLILQNISVNGFPHVSSFKSIFRRFELKKWKKL